MRIPSRYKKPPKKTVSGLRNKGQRRRDSSWILRSNLCRFVSACLAKALAVPKIICAVLPHLCLIILTAALSSPCFIFPRREPPTLSSSRRGTPLAAQGSSTVTAKNAPPERFLNAASNLSYEVRRNEKSRRLLTSAFFITEKERFETILYIVAKTAIFAFFSLYIESGSKRVQIKSFTVRKVPRFCYFFISSYRAVTRSMTACDFTFILSFLITFSTVSLSSFGIYFLYSGCSAVSPLKSDMRTSFDVGFFGYPREIRAILLS